MKNFLLRLVLCLTLTIAATTPLLALTPEEAASKEGETASVTAQCSNAKKVKSGSVYINFGGDFPNQTFSVFINKDNAEAFGDIEAFSGKTFTVTGVVKLKKGKPEMEIKSPDQLVSTPSETDAAPAAK